MEMYLFKFDNKVHVYFIYKVQVYFIYKVQV
jgi:hypothetical protein